MRKNSTLDLDYSISNICNSINDNFLLDENYATCPQHPWNKWRLTKRYDENDYTKVIQHTDNKVSFIWAKDSGECHRVDAPAYILVNEDNIIIDEVWRVNDLLHRTDGPAIISHINKWYLFDYRMDKKEHEEIVDLYTKLGDWVLAFNLSSFLLYNEIGLNINIHRIMNIV